MTNNDVPSISPNCGGPTNSIDNNHTYNKKNTIV